MRKVAIPYIHTDLYTKVLKNGLTVCILPRQDFHQTYGIFATNYGSIDQTFMPLGTREWINVPDGVAHFLEHKMFEKKEGDVFQQFGTQGASANAYTSFTRTAYLFSCTEQVEKNVETLLDFVQTPYFTEETVQKEQGIIGEEIQMYMDDTDWQLYFGTIGALFPTHPVRMDIAGTKESIAKITKDTLYACYETFYNPSNMVLFIVGNVDTQKIMHRIEENQAKKDFSQAEKISRQALTETEKPKSQQIQMSVQMPKMKVGIRSTVEINKSGEDIIRDEWIKNLLLSYLFGPQSKNYMRLMEKGLITNQFDFEYMEERSFGFGMIGGQTKHPEQLREEIFGILTKTNADVWDKDTFNLLLRKKQGQFYMAFHALDWIANQAIRYALINADFFSVPNLLSGIRMDDFMEMAEKWLVPENMTSFTITSKM